MPKNNFKVLSKEWFKRAEEDLKVAELLFKKKSFPASCCFHLHQAVEKYLKGFLVYYDKDIEEEFKIHNLPKLFGYTSECEGKLSKELKENCYNLNPYYIETRYPGEVPEYSWKEVEGALKNAKEIKKELLKFIFLQ